MFKYIAAALLSPEDLKIHARVSEAGQEDHSHYHLTTSLNDDFEIASDLQALYMKSYLAYVRRLMAELETDPEAFVSKTTKVKFAEAFKVIGEKRPDINCLEIYASQRDRIQFLEMHSFV